MRTNALSALHHHIRVEIMEWLQDDPRGQLSLMQVSQGFRRLALLMPGHYDARVNTSNYLKKQLLSVLIGGQKQEILTFVSGTITSRLFKP